MSGRPPTRCSKDIREFKNNWQELAQDRDEWKSLGETFAQQWDNTGESIKCFTCNSANNSACLDLAVGKMKTIVPIVDCGRALPEVLAKEFFCRKMIQTIMYADRSPEVRITRGCGWVKHKRACYKADNAGKLETVCQCFGDMCNAAMGLDNMNLVVLGTMATIVGVWSWKDSV